MTSLLFSKFETIKTLHIIKIAQLIISILLLTFFYTCKPVDKLTSEK